MATTSKFNQMKKQLLLREWIDVIMIMMFLNLLQCKGFSQDNQQAKQNQKEKSQTLTSEQRVLIKNILSQYNCMTLTSDQAKEIHEKFRNAGIHGSPETGDAIVAAGFDPEKLRTLDPPSLGLNDRQGSPPSTEERLKMVEEKIIIPLSLSSVQKEKVIAAFKDFFSEVEKLQKVQSNPKERLNKSQVDPLEKVRDEKIRQVLLKEQFTKYLELEKSTRPPKPIE